MVSLLIKEFSVFLQIQTPLVVLLILQSSFKLIDRVHTTQTRSTPYQTQELWNNPRTSKDSKIDVEADSRWIQMMLEMNHNFAAMSAKL